jgi:hypothetical protein
MHLPIHARARRRARRALLTAALPAVIGAVALPAAAQAGTGQVSEGKLLYTARNAEANDVVVRVGPTGKLVISDTAPKFAGAGCLLNGSGDLECDASAVGSIELSLADRNDTIRYKAPQPGIVNAGIGRDTFFGGVREAPTGPVSHLGGEGLADALRYTEADRGVTVTLGGIGGNDGRAGDLEDARGDIEVLEGSPFSDSLTGTDDELTELFLGGSGIDTIDGRGGPDKFDEGPAPNGGDVIEGGAGRDLIDYSRRASAVQVALAEGGANDGDLALGEGDNVKITVEDIITGRGDDKVFGNIESNHIRSGAGDDVISGSLAPNAIGRDTIEPGTGEDRLVGSDDDDVILARDRESDSIVCLDGLDFVTSDTHAESESNQPAGTDFVSSSCEAVDAPVGVLRLAPKALRTEAENPRG